MATELLNIAADVLEKAAAYMEAVEAEKQAVLQAERTKVAEDLRTRYSEITGENISDSLVSKLAASDTDIISLVEKLAGSTQAADHLGGPGEVREEAAPRTNKEAALAAEERFALWLKNT